MEEVLNKMLEENRDMKCSILHAIRDKQMTITELADEIDKSRPWVLQFVNQLKEAGLVTLIKNPNRKTSYYITRIPSLHALLDQSSEYKRWLEEYDKRSEIKSEHLQQKVNSEDTIEKRTYFDSEEELMKYYNWVFDNADGDTKIIIASHDKDLSYAKLMTKIGKSCAEAAKKAQIILIVPETVSDKITQFRRNFDTDHNVIFCLQKKTTLEYSVIMAIYGREFVMSDIMTAGKSAIRSTSKVLSTELYNFLLGDLLRQLNPKDLNAIFDPYNKKKPKEKDLQDLIPNKSKTDLTTVNKY